MPILWIWRLGTAAAVLYGLSKVDEAGELAKWATIGGGVYVGYKVLRTAGAIK
jgi:hypothetical protein